MQLATLILSHGRRALAAAIPFTLFALTTTTMAGELAESVRAAAPRGAIKHIMVIDLENENFADTFNPVNSPATYLNGTLLKQGELIPNYFGTSHVSLGNYVAQVSGQGTNPALNVDCLDLRPPVNLARLQGGYFDVFPGTDATDQASFPGQVLGSGCVFPAPAPGIRGVRTIGDQLDRKYGNDRHDDEEGDDDARERLQWREYAEDMGNDINRDYGSPDPLLIGADCAHPPINGVDSSNSAAANDQYATRHNPFMYFHSIIDDANRCNRHVVPLGRLAVGTNGAPDVFAGHLYQDLRRLETTPKFMFVTPNLCNDGHDATCAAPNVEGTVNAAGKNVGGLVSMDLWLKHWMPMIFASPAYQNGELLVVVTFDEANPTGDARACEKANQVDCRSPTGPNITNPGYSPILSLFIPGYKDPGATPYLLAGGGQVGAVLFNKRLIKPGTVNTTGSYNHFSALRSYEDLLGLSDGGDDGLGHLGYAAMPGLMPFGKDVFNYR
jgi:phosphatidylinositol-3-phosphatase